MNKNENFFKAVRNPEGKLSWNSKFIEPLGIEVRIGEIEYGLNPEIQKALTNTNYNFKKLNDDDLVSFTNILEGFNYNPKNDSQSTRRKYIEKHLQKRVEKYLKMPLSLATSEIEK